MQIPSRQVTPRERLGIIAAFMGLWLCSTGALVWLEQKGEAHARDGEGRLQTAQLRGCHRLNIDRARENRSWLHAYRANKGTLAYDETFKVLVVLSVQHPAPNEPLTPERRRRTALFLRKLEGEISGVQQNIAGMEWTPLTACYPATLDPLRYVPPSSHPFAVVSHVRRGGKVVTVATEDLPPASALTVGPGE